MKKNILILSFLCFFSIGYSSPVGNPAFPKVIEEGFIFSPASKFSVRLGYEGNFALDKRFKQQANPFSDINCFTLYLNSGIATINFLNRLDLFATYGEGRIEADWINEEGTNIYYYLEFESKYDEAWSCGTKIIFFEWGKVNFSAGGRYFIIDPPVARLTREVVSHSEESAKLELREWQVDVGLSYSTSFLIPYICAKYMKAKAKLSVEDLVISSNGTNVLNMKNKNSVGMALGCTFSNHKYFMLNAEARLFDEQAFTVSGEFKF